ncbi:MAG TPA: LuxR family transcriptional regulator [Stellaceae bacterium]|nr:LuxR family transcriptional regulator [Stellaceae bacterium]
MQTAFQRFMTELPDCQDLPAVKELLRRTLGNYGFDTFAYLTFTPGHTMDNAVPLTTYPEAWTQRYCRNRYDHLDPVLARSVKTTLPFSWSTHDDDDTLTRQQRRFFREADAHGIRHGFTIPIHDRRNKAATLTVATGGPRPKFEARVDSFRHELHLIALYVHARIRRALLPGEQRARPLLTEREIACIQWVAWGKSAANIAEILRIRPRTVFFHIENAKRKFGVATLPQVVAKAITQDIVCADHGGPG